MTCLALTSIRRGVGRSQVAVNLAAGRALAGARVCLIDANLRSPALHGLLGLDEPAAGLTLNDYLAGRCDIEQAAADLSAGLGPAAAGRLWLVPASDHPADITHVSRHGFDPDLIGAGVASLRETLALDLVLVELHAGIDTEMIELLTYCQGTLLVIHHNHTDHQGAALLVELLHKLELERPTFVVNEIPEPYPPAEVAASVAAAFGCPVAAALPYEPALLEGGPPIVLRRPESPFARAIAGLISSTEV